MENKATNLRKRTFLFDPENTRTAKIEDRLQIIRKLIKSRYQKIFVNSLKSEYKMLKCEKVILRRNA